MENKNPIVEAAQTMYGEIVYWIVIFTTLIATVGPVLTLYKPTNNMLNPTLLFTEIWAGADAEAIWTTVGSGLQEGHFYLSNLGTGDGLIQLGVALGCSVALWGLIPTMFQFIKEKDYTFAGFCLILSLLIGTAVLGVAQ